MADQFKTGQTLAGVSEETKTDNARTTSLSLAARALRDFGDGFVAVLLQVYLTMIGLGPFEIGLLSTAALLGSATMTFAIGLRGGSIDQRILLMGAAGLMVFTCLAFAAANAVWTILLVAAIGTINPSAGGPVFNFVYEWAVSH